MRNTERITARDSEGKAHLKRCSSMPLAIDKLAELEDAEEKGLLIHLEYPTLNPYREIQPYSRFADWIEQVEKVLEFKLFFWQKTYIETGYFRQYGETTAKILGMLCEYDKEPFDLSEKPKNAKDEILKNDLFKIKRQLDEAGVKTREVFFCDADRRRWERENITSGKSQKNREQ